MTYSISNGWWTQYLIYDKHLKTVNLLLLAGRNLSESTTYKCSPIYPFILEMFVNKYFGNRANHKLF